MGSPLGRSESSTVATMPASWSRRSSVSCRAWPPSSADHARQPLPRLRWAFQKRCELADHRLDNAQVTQVMSQTRGSHPRNPGPHQSHAHHPSRGKTASPANRHSEWPCRTKADDNGCPQRQRRPDRSCPFLPSPCSDDSIACVPEPIAATCLSQATERIDSAETCGPCGAFPTTCRPRHHRSSLCVARATAIILSLDAPSSRHNDPTADGPSNLTSSAIPHACVQRRW